MNGIPSASQTIRVAAVQAEAAWLDLQAGVDKACAIIREAGEKGVEIIGFPEVFIPGFPFKIYTSAPDEDFVLQYQKNSMVVGSPEYVKIRRAVRDAGVWAVIAFSERVGQTLFLAQSFINPNGDVVHHRRKLKPTHVERYLWGDGQGEDTKTCVTTPKGVTIGALNCWEHLQPLLRYHHYNQGCNVHIASWPYLAPSTEEGLCRWSSSSDISGDVITRMLAIEGGAFCLVCTGIITEQGSVKMGIPIEVGGPAAVPYRGGGFAAVYAPSGKVLAKAKNQFDDQLVIADIDLDDIARHKQMADCIGHYSRPDLFSLNVNNSPMPRVKYADGSHLLSIAERQPPLDQL